MRPRQVRTQHRSFLQITHSSPDNLACTVALELKGEKEIHLGLEKFSLSPDLYWTPSEVIEQACFPERCFYFVSGLFDVEEWRW
jgi:hypothetical protein